MLSTNNNTNIARPLRQLSFWFTVTVCKAYFPVNSNQIPEVLLDLSISNYLRSIMLILYRYLHSQIVSEVHPYPRCLQCATQHHRLASLSLFVDCDQKSKYHNILHAKFHLHQYRVGMGDVESVKAVQLTVGGSIVKAADTVRDLGVTLDAQLSMKPHVNGVVRSCFYIAKKNYLT